MHLVIVLRFFVRKHEIKGYLIRLVHHWPMAGNHATDVILQDAWDRLEIFIGALDQFISGIWIAGIRPEYDHVRKHRGADDTRFWQKVIQQFLRYLKPLQPVAHACVFITDV